MTPNRLQQLCEAVGERRGWDFSGVRDAREPVPWDYGEVVRRYLTPDARVLDLGTGGGERFLDLAEHFASGLGIDVNPDMIAAAEADRPAHLTHKVAFRVLSSAQLDLPDASFDLVLNRHSNLYPAEIARVLRPGGRLITQQVGRRNTESICRIFSCGPGGEYTHSADDDLNTVRRELSARGFTVEAWGEYDVPYRFLDLESFVFWLKAIPMPEDFSPERHWGQVGAIITANGGGPTIFTNEHRLLLVARKGDCE